MKPAPTPPSPKRRGRLARWLVPACLLLARVDAATGDTAYAVQASATAQSSPAQIMLSWTPGPGTTNGYAISRKEVGAGSWSPLINVVGTATSYTDTNVAAGRVYEYQIVRQASGLTGYGYLAAGVDLPPVDFRGKVILVVDNSVAPAISAEIDQWIRDAIGDGWTVARRDVSRVDSPTLVREAIRGAYNEDRANARAVFLLGHVPVPKSGNQNVDGHLARPLPADVYYGDMDGTWNDSNNDGVFDHNTIPSDIELMVGRVDFADMPGKIGGLALPAETELLKRYLQKDHDFRHAIRRITPRALIGDRAGDSEGEAFGASGFRTFSALLGPNKTTAANIEDNAPANERWISRLTAQDWLWVYGAGGGDVFSISGLGTHGQYSDVWSSDLVGLKARGTFYLLFGSWFVDWSQPDNIMRAALAAPDYGLTAAWSGRPHLYFQHLAMGEPVGYGIRLSQNNSGLYANAVNKSLRGIHIALLGDPTLRMHVVAPPSNLRDAPDGGAPSLTWTASPDASAGYHVYRGTSDAGPFTRVTDSPVTGTSYIDLSAPTGTFTYAVRAVRREVSGSGTYFNTSEAALTSASVTTPPTGGSSQPTPSPGSSSGSSGGSGGGGGGGAPSPMFVLILGVLAAWRGIRRSSGGHTAGPAV